MSQPKVASTIQVQQTITKSRRARQELELAAIELQDFMLKLEDLNIQQRKQQLEKRILEKP